MPMQLCRGRNETWLLSANTNRKAKSPLAGRPPAFCMVLSCKDLHPRLRALPSTLLLDSSACLQAVALHS